MTELDPAVLDAAAQRGESLLVNDLVVFAERMDDAVSRGVPVPRLEAYAEELSARSADTFDADDLDVLVEEDLTDAREWAGPGALYEVGDGVSAFPPRWHEELAGETDMLRVVEVVSRGITDSAASSGEGGAGRGVQKGLLLDAASAVAHLTREDATAELEQLRHDGRVEELADQHPDARVRLAGE